MREAVRAASAHLLILPPYSPDLNPIEQAFAKLKHRMRKTPHKHRICCRQNLKRSRKSFVFTPNGDSRPRFRFYPAIIRVSAQSTISTATRAKAASSAAT